MSTQAFPGTSDGRRLENARQLLALLEHYWAGQPVPRDPYRVYDRLSEVWNGEVTAAHPDGCQTAICDFRMSDNGRRITGLTFRAHDPYATWPERDDYHYARLSFPCTVGDVRIAIGTCDTWRRQRDEERWSTPSQQPMGPGWRGRDGRAAFEVAPSVDLRATTAPTRAPASTPVLPFSDEQLLALAVIRAEVRTLGDRRPTFTPAQQARLQFHRWLAQSGRLTP